METYTGLGSWAGRAEGRIIWMEPRTQYDRTPVTDRAAEIVRLKEATSDALADIGRWMEQQPTLEGRILIQAHAEALQDAAFTHRATMLIDLHGLPAPAALVEAAELVARVMGRSEELEEKARLMPVVARWLAGRMVTARRQAGAIAAAEEFSQLELLDLKGPAIMRAGEPGVTGNLPLIWGLQELGPDWNGRQARIEGNRITVITQEDGKPVQYETARRMVLATARRIKQEGLVRLTSGNVSCRLPNSDLFAITPSGMEYESLEPEDICILDLDGNLVDGRRRPSTEAPLHRLVYVRRPEVNGVVHTHSIYASAFACTGQDMPVISTELAGLVGGTIRCAPYAPSGTAEFAETALSALGAEDLALLFQSHGVMAVGATLQAACNVAIGAEEAAMIYLLARQMGEPIILPEEERRRIFRVMQTSYGQPRSPNSDPNQEG